jgi:hypothetical protein
LVASTYHNPEGLQSVTGMGLPFTLPRTNDSRIINETVDWILVKSDIEESAIN